MSSTTDLDTGPLTWVKGEIDLALGRAGEAIAAARANKDRGNNLQFAQTHLHQVRGALSIVGLDGLTSFTDSLDRLLAELARDERPYSDDLASLAERSLAAIGNYLDELSHGVPDQSLRLLPLMSELAAARGLAAPRASDLFYPDLGQQPARKFARPAPDAAARLAGRIRTLRRQFQSGLLTWLRAPDDAGGPLAMANVCAEIESAMSSPTARTFWWSAGAFFDTLANGSFARDPFAKYVSSRIDFQLKRIAAGQTTPPERLHREILYVIATASQVGPSGREVRETYDLDRLIPPPGSALCDQPLAPLLARLRTLFAAARDTWDHFASGAAAALPQFDDDLRAAIEASAPLGRPAFRHLLDTLTELVGWLRRDPIQINDQVGLEVASAVMLAETALETGRVPDASFTAQVARAESRLKALMAGEDLAALDAESAGLPDAAREAQERMALGQLAREMQVNLAQIEQTLDDYFRRPERRANLQNLSAPLRQIEGVLTVLGEDRPLEVLKDCEQRIQALADSDGPPPEGEFEYLAHHLSAFGFYVQDLQRGNADLDRLLRGMAAEEESGEADGVETEAAGVAQAESAMAEGEAFEAPAAAPEPVEESSETLEDPDELADAGVPETAAPVPPPPPQELLESSDEDIDSELLEIFLEEGREVAGTIAESLGRARANPHDVDVVTTIRRGFHTLKGSGRMVGLTDLGEAAWGLEQTMNRWLQLEWSPTPALLDLIEAAHGLFDAWIEQLASGGGVSRDARAILAEAQRLRECDQPIEESALGQAPAEPEPAPATAPEPADEPESLDLSAGQAEAAEDDAITLTAEEPESELPTLDELAPVMQEDEDLDALELDLPEVTEVQDRLPSLTEMVPDLPVAGDLDLTLDDDSVAPAPEDGRLDEDLIELDRPELPDDLVAPAIGVAPDTATTGDDEDDLDTLRETSLEFGDLEPAEEDEAPQAEMIEPLGDFLPEETSLEALESLDGDEGMPDIGLDAPETPAEPDLTIDDTAFDLEIEASDSALPIETGAVDDIDFGDLESLDVEADSEPQPEVDRNAESTAAARDDGDAAIGERDEFDLEIEAQEITAQDVVDLEPLDEIDAVEALDLDADALAEATDAPPESLDALPDEAAAADEWLAEATVADEGVATDDLSELADATESVASLEDDDDLALDLDALEPGSLDALEQEEAAHDAQDLADDIDDDSDPDQVRLGDRVISRPLFDLYLAEARQHLTTLKREIGHLANNPVLLPPDGSIRAAHTLAGISGTAHVPAIQDLAKAFEHAQARFHDSGRCPSAEQTALFGSTTETLEAMLAEVARLSLPLAVPELIEQLDAMLRLDAPELAPIEPAPEAPAPAPAASPKAEADEEAGPQLTDEFDEQLLPIFLEEAADLLSQLQSNLGEWREDPKAAAQVPALARLLHTLKGSARMAGAMSLGEYVHGLETRLEDAADTPEALIDELEAGLDSVSVSLDRIAAGPDAESAATSADAPGTDDGIAPPPDAATAEPAVAAMLAETEPTVAANLRVRADLVDKFVNEAGEIGIARTRIDGELRTLRRSLLDLTENVIRLRNQLREIEIQAETQLQSRIALSGGEDADFDPLELDRFTRLQELTRMMAESVNDVTTVQHNLLKNLDGAEAALSSQARLNRDLQQALMRVRMVPFNSVADRLHRVVRQSAKDMGKRVTLDIRAGDTEIDRGVLERMTAPLEHLLRNSIAHGIESPETRAQAGKAEIGLITLSLAQEGNEIAIELSDDGAGLDFDRIRQRALDNQLVNPNEPLDEKQLTGLIFMPGFSTAESLSTTSGRGVGMDVVKSETAAVGGRIDVESHRGSGASFRILLPVNLAVTQALLVRAGHRTFAIPSTMVAQVRELKTDALDALRKEGKVEWMGEDYPFRYLPRLVGDAETQPEVQRFNWVLLLRSGAQTLALHVDSLRGNQEVVVKNAGPHIARIVGISGATVMGDGEIVLILNPVALASRPDVLPEEVAATGAKKSAQIPTVMVVDDSLTVRKITGRLLEREGYRVITAKDGVDALERLIDTVPDVILSDIEMPRMDGFDLARNIRGDQRLKSLPIIMITSRLADKHREYAREIGVKHYLGKPYDEAELMGLIASYAPLHPSQVH